VCLTVLAVGFFAPASTLLAQRDSGVIYERPVVTAGAGPQRLAVDARLLTGGAPFVVRQRGERHFATEGLADLRLVTADGRIVPHLLAQSPSPEPEWVRGSLLGIPATKTSSGFEVDLGRLVAVDALQVEGLPVPHMKRLALDGSGDRERWTTLVAEGTLFDLPDERLRQNSLGFAPGSYRYLRVTWNDANSGRVPLPRGAAARRVSAVPQPPATVMHTGVERRPSEPGISRFRVTLPATGLPIVALELDVHPGIAGGHVYRRAVVTESRFAGNEAAPVELGRAMLSRVVREGVTAAALRVPITAPGEAEVEISIDDGANEPLDLRGVSAVLAELPWIYFEAPAGAVIARYGDRRLPKPVYDLEAVRSSIDLARVPEATWGDSGDVRVTRIDTAVAALALAPQPGPVLDAATFKYARAVDYALETGERQGGLVALALDAHALAYSRGASARFPDVRVLDKGSQQIPYLIERRNEPLAIDLAVRLAPDAQAQELKMPAGSRQRSVYLVTVPHGNLPSPTLVLETSGRVFQRTVRIGVDRPADRQRRDAYFDVRAAETWRHADEQSPARPLSLRLPTMPETELVLVVEEGDNAPLPITKARILLPSFRLRFFHTGEAGVRLAYGRDDLQLPRYDLALLAPRVMGAMAREVTAAPAPDTRTDTTAALASPRTFWFVLTGAVLVLLALIVRLIRSQGDQAAD
jgi:hypothetical protein